MGNIINENKGFETINRELIFDSTLSDRARFVYIYMSAKPDGWDFYTSEMCKELGYSENTLRKYVEELINHGWLERTEQKKNEDGKFGASGYIIKAVSPCTKNCRTVKIGTRLEERKKKSNIKEIKKEIYYINNIEKENLKEKDTPQFEQVFALWLEYKKQRRESYKSEMSKKACYNKLVKLSGNNPDIAMAIVEQSMANNWAGLFALKQDNNGNNQTSNERADSARKYAAVIAQLAQEDAERAAGIRRPKVVSW